MAMEPVLPDQADVQSGLAGRTAVRAAARRVEPAAVAVDQPAGAAGSAASAGSAGPAAGSAASAGSAGPATGSARPSIVPPGPRQAPSSGGRAGVLWHPRLPGRKPPKLVRGPG